MQTIGLIGGMSWHSTLDYYAAINRRVADELGGHHSAELLLSSLDFAEIRACQVAGDWTRAGVILAAEAAKLAAAGAASIAICTNLMHKVAPAVEGAIDVPLLHIVDAVAAKATAIGATRVGILGTDWTMREPFYRSRLAEHGIAAVAPDAEDRATVDTIIWEELTRGIVSEEARIAYAGVIERLVDRGADAVVLACTEIQLLIDGHDATIPVIDSLDAHADAITLACLGRHASPAQSPAVV